MAEFEAWVDVDVDDFLSNIDSREREELIDALVDDGYVKRVAPRGVTTESQLPSLPDILWMEKINKLEKSRLLLTQEEEELIDKICNRL
jgi:hypothetical protein